MKLCDSGKQLTQESLTRLEEVLGLPLPSDYKGFMMEANGGTPEEDLVYRFVDVATGRTNESDVRELLVIYDNQEDDNWDDILRTHTTMVEEGTIPPHFLPVATDSGGNPLCMSLRKDDFGSIWFCDHELEDRETGFL
ncbi:MAG: SMI1/KNR4 family protein, partial [Atopobiaceae bacterium]|nr:SMI1/KNR4 family protein [Atopobiaceae bacterium]